MSNILMTDTTDKADKADKPKILFVDDEANILVSLKRLFRKEGYEIFTAESGLQGIEVLKNEPIDIIVSDMRMPNMDGAEFLGLAKEIHPKTPSILLTGFSDQESTIRAINEGKIGAYVSKPWEDNDIKLKVSSLLKISHLEKEKERLLLLTHKQNKQLRNWNKKLEEKVKARVNELKQAEGMLDKAYEELSSSYDSVVKLLSHAICSKENMLNRTYTDLPYLAKDLAEAAELSDYMITQIYYASLLFELGKLALPDKLLTTPIELLSVEEYEQLMSYPEIGASILSDISNFSDTARIVEHHYEYLDGSGAPDCLENGEIPIGCKVLSIVKDYYLLQSGNIDGIKHTSKDARSYLHKYRYKLYDAKLTDLFLELSTQYEKDNDIIEEQTLKSMQLQPGMVLSRDCSNGSGLLLVSKGKSLDETMIKRLIAFEKVYDMPLTFYIKG